MIPAAPLVPGHGIHRNGFCTGCGRYIGIIQGNQVVAMEIHNPRTVPTRAQEIAPSIWRVSTERTCNRRPS